MKAAIRALALVLALASAGAAQTGPHFYDVDTETRIEGSVQDVRFEPRYEGTAPFLVLELREKAGGRVVQVEISPAWFFDRDLHRGEALRVVGSLVAQPGQPALMIAREVLVQGQTITVRDKRGFPSWRGGGGGGQGRRRGGWN